MPDQPESNYQDILDKYAASLNSTEEPKIPEPEITPPPVDVPVETPMETPIETPVEAPIEALTPPPATPELEPESPSLPPKENNFFKYLFFFSLVIFLIVLVSVLLSFINSQKSLINNKNIPTISPTAIPVAKCEINDQKYLIGESFTATDGCNTCTCNADLTIACTQMACLSPTPTTIITTATPSATKVPTKAL